MGTLDASPERRAAGAVVSLDPLITIGKNEIDLPMGLASLWPERFEGKPSLHLIGLTWSGEQHERVAELVADVAEARSRLPRATFVLLASTPNEAVAFSRAGIPNIVANGTLFVDERQFPPATPSSQRRYDAAYTARLDPFKRHELAAEIPSVALVYGPPTDAELELAKYILPRAHFANHANPERKFRYFDQRMIAKTLGNCAVGLCLSAVEGHMRAAAEYHVCGLPVVSTHSVGGRDRYLAGPLSRIVDADPDSVARAVADLKALELNPLAVRDHVGALIALDRHNFLIALNQIVERELGVRERFRSFSPFLGLPVTWRKTSDISTDFLPR